ncbi:phosphoribosylanthranilate isomerase [Clostridium uliginosum]|uniref:N-(5'-phosphoribosyl)anthranilate isomerase n=1 Tax=Clostridium uliginosum TaxID=119641 RepID=A0A1I1H561_9CLOT|nr:phosphoribosylanthranilate isomerase [Clostridium uliginosum]SFC18951.1 phosphoribosylanthranilate isomerase [Clostridium uliginosum]
MVKIKICGITNLEEIDYVNELRPEYIGFVFTESKRKIDKKTACLLSIGLIDEIKKVGVFRNNSIEEILDVLKEVPLDVIQLHGYEDENYIELLRRSINHQIKIWKALSIDKKINLQKYKSDYIDNFILDGLNPGSGEIFSWSNIKKEEIANNEFFLAGGINEENVLAGIEATNPNGIDVSSGVEFINKNGERMKSFEKMKKLIRKVRENYEGKI